MMIQVRFIESWCVRAGSANGLGVQFFRSFNNDNGCFQTSPHDNGCFQTQPQRKRKRDVDSCIHQAYRQTSMHGAWILMWVRCCYRRPTSTTAFTIHIFVISYPTIVRIVYSEVSPCWQIFGRNYQRNDCAWPDVKSKMFCFFKSLTGSPCLGDILCMHSELCATSANKRKKSDNR